MPEVRSPCGSFIQQPKNRCGTGSKWPWFFLLTTPPTKVCPLLYGNTPTTAILLSYARLELLCCLKLKPNGGQKGYHRMSTLRLERFDFVISALWGMGFTNWICVTSPVSDQAYFTFWKPAKVRQTENEHLFWLDNFFFSFVARSCSSASLNF